MKALVTMTLGKQWESQHGHDPVHKKTGSCPIENSTSCTDVTGSNHTVLMNIESLSDIFRRARDKNASVVRIEFITGERFSAEEINQAYEKFGTTIQSSESAATDQAASAPATPSSG